MKEIIIIKTDNSQALRNYLDTNHLNYKIYQEQAINNSQEENRRRLIEAYKRSAGKNRELFADLERTSINDVFYSTKK
jgi:chaperone required for assembly of F1-ATPase